MTNTANQTTASHSAIGFGWCSCGTHFGSFWSLGEHLVANGSMFGISQSPQPTSRVESCEDYAAGVVKGHA